MPTRLHSDFRCVAIELNLKGQNIFVKTVFLARIAPIIKLLCLASILQILDSRPPLQNAAVFLCME